MFNMSSQELLIILVIALIVVGPQRLPELSRSIGKGLRELRKVQDDMKDMVKFDLEPDRPTPARRPASPTSPGVHRTPKPAAAAPPAAVSDTVAGATDGSTVAFTDGAAAESASPPDESPANG
jgi:sec-independent protein translocase protein TatB